MPRPELARVSRRRERILAHVSKVSSNTEGRLRVQRVTAESSPSFCPHHIPAKPLPPTPTPCPPRPGPTSGWHAPLRPATATATATAHRPTPASTGPLT